MQEKHPTSGGSWMRNPETGELTQIEEVTRWEAPPAEPEAASVQREPVAVLETVTPVQPASETAAAEPPLGSEVAPVEAPVLTGKRNR